MAQTTSYDKAKTAREFTRIRRSRATAGSNEQVQLDTRESDHVTYLLEANIQYDAAVTETVTITKVNGEGETFVLLSVDLSSEADAYWLPASPVPIYPGEKIQATAPAVTGQVGVIQMIEGLPAT